MRGGQTLLNSGDLEEQRRAFLKKTAQNHTFTKIHPIIHPIWWIIHPIIHPIWWIYPSYYPSYSMDLSILLKWILFLVHSNFLLLETLREISRIEGNTSPARCHHGITAFSMSVAQWYSVSVAIGIPKYFLMLEYCVWKNPVILIPVWSKFA